MVSYSSFRATAGSTFIALLAGKKIPRAIISSITAAAKRPQKIMKGRSPNSYIMNPKKWMIIYAIIAESIKEQRSKIEPSLSKRVKI